MPLRVCGKSTLRITAASHKCTILPVSLHKRTAAAWTNFFRYRMFPFKYVLMNRLNVVLPGFFRIYIGIFDFMGNCIYFIDAQRGGLIGTNCFAQLCRIYDFFDCTFTFASTEKTTMGTNISSGSSSSSASVFI